MPNAPLSPPLPPPAGESNVPLRRNLPRWRGQGREPVRLACPNGFAHLSLLFLSMLCFSPTLPAQGNQAFFLAPTGNDQNPGTQAAPMATIARGIQTLQAGDTLYLLPGTYSGPNQLKEVRGEPDQPIVIRSHSRDPLQFAIIDRGSPPASDARQEGFELESCAWIELENLVFRNCWTSVISLVNTPYISVKGCHFSSGKRVIHAQGNGTHHVLVENCWLQYPDAVWQGWSWESLHHGEVGYYNGALLHPNQSGGGHIMRHNTLINPFNGFRTRPVRIQEDGNTEIYGNLMVNVRDNEFEPETWAWNMHYAYNHHVNVHKFFSIDGVEGGNIYLYGNTYTQTTDPWAIEEVSGIFKYKNGPLTYPCYAFNNSFYTEAKVLRKGESTNHLLKHYSNAYQFFGGVDRFQLVDWQPGYEFDYDCINQEWPVHIQENLQEIHGLPQTDPGFVDGLGGQFQLRASSPCIDAGKVMQLPEFDWVQQYQGTAPDIGAFEGKIPTDGPAFRFIPSPAGALYAERPRISKHEVSGKTLTLYFTAAMTVVPLESIALYQNGTPVEILEASFPFHAYQLVLQTAQLLDPEQLSIRFPEPPSGQNGLSLTHWGSTLAVGTRVISAPSLAEIPIPHSPLHDVPEFKEAQLVISPNPFTDQAIFKVVLQQAPSLKFINHISLYEADGGELTSIYEPRVVGTEVHFDLGNIDGGGRLPPGNYLAKVRVGKRILETPFTVLNDN